ncbi:MAG TPA: hypothetical protein VNJ31_06455 [Methyloceanibacter sp.]|nr:hypothetical protein [Methyloceanibacter sp.]
MGWLRRDKDCIALVVVWAFLFQATILSFTSAAHAATLASSRDIVLCTAKGAVIGRALPGQSHGKADCQCCALSCRLACGGACAGLIPLALRTPLPDLIEAQPMPLRRLEPLAPAPQFSPAKPRAPPLA